MGTFSTPEAFVFQDGNSNNNALATAAMMNGGGFGGGYNSPFWALIMLAFLRQWGWDGNGNGNGNGCGCLTQNQLASIQNTLNTNQGQTLLMNAITGNGTGIKELASALNCNQNAVTAAIYGIQTAIANVSNQNNMNDMQIVNSVQSGNTAIANQICQCCCDVKTEAMRMGYENQINNLNQSNMITKGFGDITNATQLQTSAIAANNDANTRAVLSKLDQIEDSRKDREIAALTAEKASLLARAERQAELAPIVQKLSDIMCKQPTTYNVAYQPFTAVPNCIAYQAFGLNPFVNGGNFG